MLSIKERRFALEYVKNPEAKPGAIVMKVTSKQISTQTASIRAKKYLANPEVQEYIEQLQSSVAKQLNLDQLKQVKKLQKIYKAGLKTVNDKPVNLVASIQAITTINQMLGLDKVQKPPINLRNVDTSSPELILSSIMNLYLAREIDKEEYDSMIKGVETLTTFKIAKELQDQLKKGDSIAWQS